MKENEIRARGRATRFGHADTCFLAQFATSCRDTCFIARGGGSFWRATDIANEVTSRFFANNQNFLIFRANKKYATTYRKVGIFFA